MPLNIPNKDSSQTDRQSSDGRQSGGFLGNISSQTSSSSSAPETSSGVGDSRQGRISLPVGGGAVRGIGEKFEANPVTGTASFSVPITISEGRGGFTPQLSLSYDSGSGNSVFGLGWSVGLPSITRKTDKGLPQYNDNADNESDTFILSGAEDLVPILDNAKQFFREENGYKIYSYQPRTEGLFALIERWTKDGISHWRTVSKENITSIYGFSANSRIFDPENSKKIFSWLIEKSWDAKGNLMCFSYKQENNENIENSCYENFRLKKGVFSNKYLQKVSYGNAEMCSLNGDYNGDFHFNLLFDYGESESPNSLWLARSDAFSSYKSGFEIRTYRLCRRILMYHNFENSVLVRSTELEYEKNKSFSLLKKITHKGYDGALETSLPPLTFSYTQAVVAESFKEVSEEMLKQLPSGVDGQNYQWADLHSEGVSGILTMNNNAWYFKPNYGSYPSPNSPEAQGGIVFGSMRSEIPKPSAANNRKTTFRLNDVDSDGYPELVIQGDGINGYYTRDEEGKWLNFRNFQDNPNINYNDPNLRFIDLSGNGLADIVISKGDTFDIYFSEGKKGFGNYRRVRCGKENGNAPQLLFSDPKQTVFLADMSGDGLTDIVKITNQNIIYFPNIGYGKFGEKVVMSNPPLLDSADLFDARFVHLADVDGTGTTDLLYISKGKIRYFKNLSGNSWEEEILPNTVSVTATKQTFIQMVDLLGNGTQCLVVSSSLPAQAKKMRYLELSVTPPLWVGAGGGVGVKPFLLNEIDNNMGGITRLHYAPSTKFYMQDKFSGKAWITKLPFPVQTLEKVEIIDLVGNKHFTNRYAYHHGYYDPVEREFRGFGMVEQWDTENYNTSPNPSKGGELSPPFWGGAGGEVEQFNVPPIYTKTWFHTGFYNRREKISRHFEKEYFDGDSDAWLLPDTVLPADLNGEEAREACRALRGSPLRVEIYTASPASTSLSDQTGELSPPLWGGAVGGVYTIEEKSYKLQCLQPKGSNKHAVFLKTESESLMYNYERNIDDPRILHKLVLETDCFGNEKKSAQIAYQRRTTSNGGAGGGQLPSFGGAGGGVEQQKILATYSENDFINIINNNNRLIGVPYQTKQYEIHNLNNEENKYNIDDLLEKIQQANLIDYAAIPSEIGSLSVVETRLIQHVRTLFWDENCTQPLPLGQASAQALPYQQQTLELTQELINKFNFDGEKITENLLLQQGKYIKINNNYFAVGEIQHFNQNAFYLPDIITDPFGNITAMEYDIYSLFPTKITDALGFETVAEYDYRVLQPQKLTDPNGNSQEVEFDALGMVIKLAVCGKNGEGDTLNSPLLLAGVATEEYDYDLHCWKNAQKPVFAHVKKREIHADNNTRWLESYVYTDGLGNEIMTKTTAEDGLAWTASPNPSEGGESPPPLGELEGAAPIGVEQTPCVNRWLSSGKVIYNNKGLAVKQYEPWFSDTHEFTFEDELTNYGVTPIMYYDPLGRLIKTDFPDGTTTKVEFDAWQQKNYDQNDCDQNSPHFNTPQVIDLDVLGRPFKTTDVITNSELRITKNKLDIAGRILEVTDALGRIATKNIYALSEKHILTVDNIDSGKRWLLNDTAGKPIKKWDSKNNEFSFIYDELQRPTDTFVNNVCTEKLIYGVDSQANNIGQVIESYAQDGKTSFEYDFKGNVILQKKQFAENYDTQIDWNNNNSVISSDSEKSFEIETTFDALNRPTTITNPDNSVLNYEYDKGGMLKKVLKDNVENISNIKYNEKGQRTDIYYGNNTKTRYYYNALNFRLERILTTRNSGQDILQDLNYEFDAVGNIVKQTDNAQTTHFFSNQIIEPTSTYEYDALYRLTKATGREKDALSMPTHEDFPNLATPSAVQNYVQKYEYDALGNILQMQSAGEWTRNYIYDTQTNRLLKHDENQSLNDYTYDEHGNMLTMPHLSSMLWNEKDELISATNGTFTSYYNYDSQGNRTRKVVVKNNVREERYYINGYEIFKKYVSDTLDFERKTINISDDEKVFARIEQKDNEQEIVKYQYDNHLGSACLELDENGAIISYEEYHPFGTTSYRSGHSETEVSQKRYKYCGKERDEASGLYYYGARYYLAWLCRFMSCDPLQFEYPHYTPYQYAGNKPITFIDLDGKEESTPDPQNQDNRNPAFTIKTIFALSGMLTDFNTNFVKFTRGKYDANATVQGIVSSSGLTSDTKDPAKNNEWVNSKGIFYANDYSINTVEFTNYLLGSMIYGVGYENIVFPTNGAVSSSLKNAGIVNDALSAFYTANKGKTNNFLIISDQFSGNSLKNNPKSIFNNGMFHPETFIGSAFITVTPHSATELLVTIFNISSLSSGDFFKHFNNYPMSIVRNPNLKQGDSRNHYANISQTYSFTLPIDFNRLKK